MQLLALLLLLLLLLRDAHSEELVRQDHGIVVPPAALLLLLLLYCTHSYLGAAVTRVTTKLEVPKRSHTVSEQGQAAGRIGDPASVLGG